jgi:hypothetical protein
VVFTFACRTTSPYNHGLHLGNQLQIEFKHCHNKEGSMNRKYLSLLCLSLSLLVLLSACAGGTSGSVRNSSQTCRALGGSGGCDGRIGRLSGTYGIDIEDEGISPGDQVWVELVISVEVGSVRVSIEDPDGGVNSVDVDPSAPVQLTGSTQGEFDGFGFGFQALDEFAEGITYSLTYAIQ